MNGALSLALVVLTLCTPFLALAGTEDAGPQAAEVTPPVTEVRPMDELGVPNFLNEISNETWVGGKGHVHPFIGVGEYYTDNIFYAPSNEEDEFYTVISPGLWLALPASRQQLVNISTDVASPGGLKLSRFRTAADRPFQGYALYRADIERHASFSDEDRVNHKGEGLMQFTSKAGYSLEILDIYEKNQDPYYTGSLSRRLDQYSSNLADVSIGIPIGKKLNIVLNYANFMLRYDNEFDSYRERDDNKFAADLSYKATPNTSVLLLYEYIDVDYDERILSDSSENNIYAGLQWNATAKSRGRVMLGYGAKDFSERDIDDRNEAIGEARLDHFFTRKTSAYLRLNRKLNESDIPGAESTVANLAQLGYRQRLTGKITAAADVYYRLEQYNGEVTVGSRTDEREDDYYGAGASLRYAAARWLVLAAGYRFIERQSNFEAFDYRNNTAFFSITAGL
jgi:hypothetical protein